MGFIEQKTFIIDDMDENWKFFKLERKNRKLYPLDFTQIHKGDIIMILDLDNECPIEFNFKSNIGLSPYLKVIHGPYFSLDLPEGTEEIKCISCLHLN